jgi:hypothetical protein
MPDIDIDQWQAALHNDHRLSSNARFVAAALAERFQKNAGFCQRSIEGLAGDANIISRNATAEALAMLRLTGWLISERVPNTPRCGMVHRPVMALHHHESVAL